MRCRSWGSTVLASTTPRGFPKLPSGSVNTRSTVTSMAMGRCYFVPRPHWRPRLGGAAFVGAHRVEHRNTGVHRARHRTFADAGAQQTAQIILVVDRGLGRVDEALHD